MFWRKPLNFHFEKWLDQALSLDYVALCVPLFILAMVVEFWLSRRQQRTVYRINDTIGSLACGMQSQLAGLVLAIPASYLYLLIENHYAMTSLRDWQGGELATVVFILGFFGVDFCYYWYHRASHRLNIGWASHSVHHQSEEYNFSTALRQSSSKYFFASLFYLPLAFLGLPFLWLVSFRSLNLLYQFWIHTRLIDRCPSWFEKVFNTPSHHRVHHGRNPHYVDRNYAGILIVWDKMFGTFYQEKQEPDYGLVKPLNSFNCLWAEANHYWSLVKQSRSTPGLFHKIALWFKPPGWAPEHPKPEIPHGPYEKFDPLPSKNRKTMGLGLFLFGLVLGTSVTELSIESSDIRLILGFLSILCFSISGVCVSRSGRSHAEQALQ